VNTTDSGKPAVDYAALVEIKQQFKDNPTRVRIIALIMEQAKYKKILSTYDLRVFSLYERDGRGWVHTSFNNEGTATNRLSSEGPNVQNQPSRGEWMEMIRGGIVPPEGWIWACFDLSQIEPRGGAMIAYILGDPGLKSDLEDPERGDPYKSLASGLTGIPYEQITKEIRDTGKVAMLAIIYGSSAQALAENPTMRPLGRNGEQPTKEDIQAALDALFVKYPGLKKYQRNILFWALKSGYAESFWGFRRPAFDLASRKGEWRTNRAGESRALRNFGIQGWAAEYLKSAMLWADSLIEKYNLRDRIKIVLTVHDEVDALVRKDSINIAVALFRLAMTKAWDAKIPLKCDAELGASWGTILDINKWKEVPPQNEDTEQLIASIQQEVSPFLDFPLAREVCTPFDMTTVSFEDYEPFAWHAARLDLAIDDPRLPMMTKESPEGYLVDVREWKKNGVSTWRGKLVCSNGVMDIVAWDVPLKEGFTRLTGKWSDKYRSFQVSRQDEMRFNTSLLGPLLAGKVVEIDGYVIHFDRLKRDCIGA
jgi:hypothetical protein